MFFKKAFEGENAWWRYIIVILVISFGYMIGQLPLTLALLRSLDNNADLGSEELQEFGTNPDFSRFGINPNLGFTLLLMMFIGAMVAFFFIFKPMHGREFRSLVTPYTRINWGKVIFAFLCWLGLTLLFEAVGYFLSPEDYSFHFKINTFLPLVVISLLILPIQTSMEELLFRGYLLQGLGVAKTSHILSFVVGAFLGYGIYKILGSMFGFSDGDAMEVSSIFIKIGLAVLGIIAAIALTIIIIKMIGKSNLPESHFLNQHTRWLPLIITSVLFGLIHSMNPEIKEYGFYTMQLYYVSAGLVLGIMTIMDDGLELALGVHAATNFAGAVFVGYSGAAIQTESLFKTETVNPQMMTIFFFAISAIFLLFLRYKFNWTSFSKIFKPIQEPNKASAIDHLIHKV